MRIQLPLSVSIGTSSSELLLPLWSDCLIVPKGIGFLPLTVPLGLIPIALPLAPPLALIPLPPLGLIPLPSLALIPLAITPLPLALIAPPLNLIPLDVPLALTPIVPPLALLPLAVVHLFVSCLGGGHGLFSSIDSRSSMSLPKFIATLVTKIK